jgi:hypothetical protein
MGVCQWYADKNGYPQLVAEQIKEKFGELRFYYRFEDKGEHKPEQYAFLEGVISFAETMSPYTCERCGEKGEINNRGWLSCRCAPCRRKDTQ